MATRSLTEVFILMRNNALQSRHIYSEQRMTDTESLVQADIELDLRGSSESKMPPVWIHGLEDAQYSLTRLRIKIHELETLHNRHLLRPTLDDSSDEEQQIEILTRDITRMFSAAHRIVQQIKQHSNDGNPQEKRLSYNVISSLVTTVQELSTTFRQAQSSYLKKLASREERSRQYFETSLNLNSPVATNFAAGDWDLDNETNNIDKQFSSHLDANQQLLLIEDNTKLVANREREVKQIVDSIIDLNDIFKDLSHMVADQGSILDRIDYNIEQVGVQVHQGYQQLQKAETYQKKNRKMVCILILATVTILLLILLIILKS